MNTNSATVSQISARPDEDSTTNFYRGSWVSLTNVMDALIPYVGLDFGSFNLGITYDMNVRAFQAASEGRGSYEISLLYTRKTTEANPARAVVCPKF